MRWTKIKYQKFSQNVSLANHPSIVKICTYMPIKKFVQPFLGYFHLLIALLSTQFEVSKSIKFTYFSKNMNLWFFETNLQILADNYLLQCSIINKWFPIISDSSRKRKGDRSISPSEDTERKHKRDKSEPSSPPGKKDRKPDRKRVKKLFWFHENIIQFISKEFPDVFPYQDLFETYWGTKGSLRENISFNRINDFF